MDEPRTSVERLDRLSDSSGSAASSGAGCFVTVTERFRRCRAGRRTQPGAWVLPRLVRTIALPGAHIDGTHGEQAPRRTPPGRSLGGIRDTRPRLGWRGWGPIIRCTGSPRRRAASGGSPRAHALSAHSPNAREHGRSTASHSLSTTRGCEGGCRVGVREPAGPSISLRAANSAGGVDVPRAARGGQVPQRVTRRAACPPARHKTSCLADRRGEPTESPYCSDRAGQGRPGTVEPTPYGVGDLASRRLLGTRRGRGSCPCLRHACAGRLAAGRGRLRDRMAGEPCSLSSRLQFVVRMPRGGERRVTIGRGGP